MKGLEPRRHDQPVVLGAGGLAQGIDRMYRAPGPVHGRHGIAGVQQDMVILVPGPVVEHDIAERLLAGEHGRQQNAVVVGMRLGAEDRDVIL